MLITGTLLSLTAGYFVFAHASAQKADVKQIGRVIGLLIIGASLVGLVCSTLCMAKRSGCGMMSRGGAVCPMK